MPRLAVIIVSWNVRALLDRCIASVRESLAGSAIDATVAVVDNNSADGSAAMLRERHPNVLLIESGRNLGFAGGNNLGLRRLLESPPGAPFDYFLLLNPDTEVRGDALPQMVAYLEDHPDVALVGPQLCYADGSTQSSRRRFPQRTTFFWESTPLAQRWPGNPWARHYHMADRADGDAQDVDWLVGAALLVRRSVIERAGLMDDGFALYSEELEWQRRINTLAAKPHRIVYLPSALIIHHEGQSSGQVPARRLIAFQRSRLRDAEMVYGAAFARMVRMFLRGCYAVELAQEAAKWLLGHKRPLRAERVRTYAEVLRSLAR